MLCYLGWLLRVDGSWRRIVRLAVLVSFVDGWDCFLFLISLPPLRFVDVTTSDEDDVILDYGRNEARDKDCEWVVDRHAMRKLCFPCVVLSRFRHFGDIIAASHQTLIMCSSQASDGKLLAPAAGIIWVLNKKKHGPLYPYRLK